MTAEEIDRLCEQFREMLTSDADHISVQCVRHPEEIPSIDGNYRRFRAGPETVITITIRHEMTPASALAE